MPSEPRSIVPARSRARLPPRAGQALLWSGHSSGRQVAVCRGTDQAALAVLADCPWQPPNTREGRLGRGPCARDRTVRTEFHHQLGRSPRAGGCGTPICGCTRSPVGPVLRFSPSYPGSSVRLFRAGSAKAAAVTVQAGIVAGKGAEQAVAAAARGRNTVCRPRAVVKVPGVVHEGAARGVEPFLFPFRGRRRPFFSSPEVP